MKTRISVLIAEDEPAILRSIRTAILKICDDFYVVGTAYNGADALKQIRTLRPQIVFSDIRMPVVSGISMISKAREEGISSHFVILTGYAEFEYARQALTLNVDAYLLKPIVLEDLRGILTSLRQKVSEELMQQQKTYIQRCFHDPSSKAPENNPLKDYCLQLLFCYFGPVASNVYGELNPAKEYACSLHQSRTPQSDDSAVYAFPGNYFNEYVCAIVWPNDRQPRTDSIIQSIRDTTKSTRIYTNYIVSPIIQNGNGISKAVRDCYLYTLFHIPFAKSRLQYYQELTDTKTPITVTPQIHECFPMFHSAITSGQLESLVSQLADLWSTLEVTQFQLHEDITALLRHCYQQSVGFCGPTVNSAEIIATAYTYPMLCENLNAELQRIFLIQDGGRKDTAKALIEDVKSYLDTNFTKNITCRTLTDIWGYNEKYISDLFRKKYLISPSKYIVKLRIDLSKELMAKNPDILLKDVAEAVGYSDALYFSRVFKNNEGVPPSAFMKSETTQPPDQGVHGFNDADHYPSF